MGGNYPPGGKVGVYSAIAGLKKPAPRAPVTVPLALLEKANMILHDAGCKATDTLIALHTMSGNTNTKSIQPTAVPDLISPLLDAKGVHIVHLGGAGEAVVDHPRFISLQGALSWQEVFAVLACCNGCVCIDSAIMHIAQHLNIPTVSLWGPTSPAVILDDPPGVTCVVSTMPCAGCGRYECDRGGCMTKFNKLTVKTKLKKLLEGGM